jgi:hypothetical protein
MTKQIGDTCGHRHTPYGGAWDAPWTCRRTLTDIRPDLLSPTPVHKGHHQMWSLQPERDYKDIFGEEKHVDAWWRLHDWSTGGSSSSASYPLNEYRQCESCGCDFRPKSHMNLTEDATACFFCSLWIQRAEEYASGNVARDLLKPQGLPGRRSAGNRYRGVRVEGDPTLYTWSEGSSGAFGDRKAIVEWFDGLKVGPASSLWSGGDIPWEFDHLFIPNGTIDWIPFKEKV